MSSTQWFCETQIAVILLQRTHTCPWVLVSICHCYNLLQILRLQTKLICYFIAPGIRHSEIKVLTELCSFGASSSILWVTDCAPRGELCGCTGSFPNPCCSLVESLTQGTTCSSGLLLTAASPTPSVETEARLNFIQAVSELGMRHWPNFNPKKTSSRAFLSTRVGWRCSRTSPAGESTGVLWPCDLTLRAG